MTYHYRIGFGSYAEGYELHEGDPSDCAICGYPKVYYDDHPNRRKSPVAKVDIPPTTK